MSEQYLHGYDADEQDRLHRQADFANKFIYENLDFSKHKSLLEIGCGTGGQSEILLSNYPNLQINAVDVSASQLVAAEANIEKAQLSNRIIFTQVDGTTLPFDENQFDAAFYCWVLEHVPNIEQSLSETYRTLKPGGEIMLTEVFNASNRLEPLTPAYKTYWTAFNELQSEMGGNPDVGFYLGRHLADCGFRIIESRPLFFHLDKRDLERRNAMLEYWEELLLSAQEGLLAAGKVTPALIAEFKTDMAELRKNPETIFFYTGIQITAEK